MPKKLTIDEVRGGFKKRGWTLISTEYRGSQKKLEVICDCGHQTTITWNNFQRGQGCNVCAGNQKFSLDEVKKQFEEQGFELLDTNYVNNNIPVKCRCSCGNITKMPLATIKQGSNCYQCRSKKISKSLMISEDIIRNFCDKSGCKYINHWVEHKDKSGNKVGRSKLKYICSCGKEAEAIWWNFKRFPGCWECSKKKKSGDKCHLWNPNRDQVALNKILQKRCWSLVGRTLGNKFKDNNKAEILGYSVDELSQMLQEHPLYNPYLPYHIDHIFPVSAFASYKLEDMKLINSLTNLRPLYDKINLSKSGNFYERAFKEWLSDPSKNAESVIEDTVIKDCKDNAPEIRLIDPKKAKEKGVLEKEYYELINEGKQFLFIHPYEWISKREQVIHRSQVMSGLIGLEKVGARKCTIDIINSKELKVFCAKYHLQGSNKLSKIGFGLKYKKRLLGVLSLGRHHRGGNQLVLDRLCFRAGYHVSGGSERLLKEAKLWAKNSGFNSIITFSDNRYTDGKVYERLDFEKEKSYNCDYSYTLKTDCSIYYSKQSQSKKNSNCPSDMTEIEWAKARGLIQIWDLGKVRWMISF